MHVLLSLLGMQDFLHQLLVPQPVHELLESTIKTNKVSFVAMITAFIKNILQEVKHYAQALLPENIPVQFLKECKELCA